MARVNVIVEGQTEEQFIKNVASVALADKNVFLNPILIGKPGHKGGIRSYASAKDDFLRVLKQDVTAYVTTMLDYYAMPDSWPGRNDARKKHLKERARTVEGAILADIMNRLDERYRTDIRFIPYVQMHEFEALLFADPAAMAKELARADLHEAFQAIRDDFGSPEEIDDSPLTAPSKRIEKLHPGYDKPKDGNVIAMEIGVQKMRDCCPHFQEWLTRLEQLGL